MTDDRPLRLRLEAHARPASRRPRGTPSFLGRVVDGGSAPTAVGRFVLLEPVRLDGAEAEGAAATVAADASRRIPALWLGPKLAVVGDLAVAHDAGGRWVVDRVATSADLQCGSCTVPKSGLTLSWINGLMGSGSAPMAFDGADGWATSCVNGIVFRLRCAGGPAAFTAAFHPGGTCPAGTPVTCTGPGSSPLGLTLTAQSCSPLLLQYATTACPTLSSQGYTRFTVTQ